MTARSVLRTLLAIAFATAGGLHLLFPEPFVDITPDWVPMAFEVVRLTGVAEIAGALGLMSPRTRRWAAIALALYCVCVFPANINHAVIDLDRVRPLLGWAYHGPRLLLQPVIVWACLWAGNVIAWPFRRSA
ncbi:DoxX family protein [Brevundimonas sp. NIBR11]|uniref:DoxX family protein n=1 Tax=Brevundimonas sp. NIBR11 TaxID=3015999 RepID=UPI0022F0FCF3|nr:DoxX family protein [Brevundimonas sp. NIBR11]